MTDGFWANRLASCVLSSLCLCVIKLDVKWTRLCGSLFVLLTQTKRRSTHKQWARLVINVAHKDYEWNKNGRWMCGSGTLILRSWMQPDWLTISYRQTRSIHCSVLYTCRWCLAVAFEVEGCASFCSKMILDNQIMLLDPNLITPRDAAKVSSCFNSFTCLNLI